MKNKPHKPKEGERYWYIEFHLSSFEVGSNQWYKENIYAQKDYKTGNCFKTKKQAQEKLTQIKKLLKK